MTQAEIKLCSLLLQEHFGEIVEKIGTYLIRTGGQPLRAISAGTGLLLDQVKKALCVLIQHNLVSYQLQKRGFVEYEAQCKRVLRILRYPRYIYAAKTLYGDTGELLAEELLLNGQMTMSNLVRKVADRLTETMEDGKTMDYTEVSNTFVRLADTHFIQRCPLGNLPGALGSLWTPGWEGKPPGSFGEPLDTRLGKEMLSPLKGKGKRRRSCEEEESGEPKAKKQKRSGESSEPPPDDGIYWQVNLDRFHQHFRDQSIISAVANRMDQTSSEIVRTMLRMSEVTTSSTAPYTAPLSSNEIFRSLPAGYNIGKQVLDQYLTLLADDPVRHLGSLGCWNAGAGLWRGVKSHGMGAPSVFGSRCARIFRLLLRKKHLEQKQVEDFAMIPAKEAKDMLYKMLSENFVSLQEIPKTPDHAPSRTFYLYTVNVLSSARMLLHRCYKSVANLMERRQHETKENK
ncbi:RPC3 polymerase, partial [Centropus unirufus]|nr:RPC3 polymerase [Centropus unirufus]